MMKNILPLLMISFFFSFVCNAGEKENLRQFPDRQVSFYGGEFSSQLHDKIRIFEGNPAKYLKEIDDFEGYKNHLLTQSEEKLFLDYFSYLPPKLQSIVLENVYAIYFVDEMWYGGQTKLIFDENNRPYCVFFFNANTFYWSMSEWLSYRDNTIFSNTDDENRLFVECSDEFAEFFHILIHESAHVYDFINKVTPGNCDKNRAENTDEGNLYYSVWKNRLEPLEQYRNKKFEKTGFYEYGEKLSVSDGKEIVDYLKSSPFSTLYAAKNWQDDFADTLTFWYLREKFGIDYRLLFIENASVKAVYSYKDNPNAKIWDSLCESISK